MLVHQFPRIPPTVPRYPLVMSKELLEMAIEIVDFPMKNGGFSIVFCNSLPEATLGADVL